jgi:hypothetical protein
MPTPYHKTKRDTKKCLLHIASENINDIIIRRLAEGEEKGCGLWTVICPMLEVYYIVPAAIGEFGFKGEAERVLWWGWSVI